MRFLSVLCETSSHFLRGGPKLSLGLRAGNPAKLAEYLPDTKEMDEASMMGDPFLGMPGHAPKGQAPKPDYERFERLLAEK